MHIKRPSPGWHATCMGISAGLALLGISEGWDDALNGFNIVVAVINFTALLYHPDVKIPIDDDYDDFSF